MIGSKLDNALTYWERGTGSPVLALHSSASCPYGEGVSTSHVSVSVRSTSLQTGRRSTVDGRRS